MFQLLLLSVVGFSIVYRCYNLQHYQKNIILESLFHRLRIKANGLYISLTNHSGDIVVLIFSLS